MTVEFEKLVNLEKTQKITVGLNTSHSNNFWFRTTSIGKILNLLTYLFSLALVIVFIKLGIISGFFSLAGLCVYVLLTQKLASLYTRVKLLQDERLFNAAYEHRSCTIRNNVTSQITYFPSSWREVIQEYY